MAAPTRTFAKLKGSPLFGGLASMFRPRRRQKLSDWAEDNLVLAAERSASPGPYRIGDAVYQRKMMDCVTDPDVEQVVYVTSSQVGKTTVLTAVQGYYAEAEPSPQLSVWPDNIAADEYVRETLEPTVRDSVRLSKLFDGLTYPGGYIAFVGANTPKKLAARPIRVITGDEVDRWPQSSGTEGSPVDLAEKRTTTFRNRKKVYASTPLHTKNSIIVAMFKECEQHYYLVTCPECDTKQILRWENVRYEKGKESDAHYSCEHCGALWTEQLKRKLVREGKWSTLPETPFKQFKTNLRPKPGHVGFYVCELYSPWSSMAEMALAWSHAEGNPTKEQTFFNTRLGLPWDGAVSNSADVERLKARREQYSPKRVPRAAGLITAAVDIQDDRFEVLTQAWGVGEESWVLEHIKINVDPSTEAAWTVLTETLLRGYPHETKPDRILRPEVVCIDTGGHFTQKAYAFVKKHEKLGRRWHGIKGISGEGKPIIKLSEQKFKNGTQLYLVGVDDAKTLVYTRFGIERPGPGYVHFHEGITDDLLKQATCEYAVVEYDGNGFPKRHWEKKQNDRNEMLDLLVYNVAARSSINIDMVTRMTALYGLEEKKLNPEMIGRLYKQDNANGAMSSSPAIVV